MSPRSKEKEESVIKKFGLNEARKLAGEPDAHLPTVRATLKILGVPNIVGKQVAKLVAFAQAVVQVAIVDKGNLRIADAEDEKTTIQTIANLRTARDNRGKENLTKVAGCERVANDHRQVIADLQELAKKFA